MSGYFGGGSVINTLLNNEFLKGLNTSAVAKNLIGVNSSDLVSIDSNALGTVFGGKVGIGVNPTAAILTVDNGVAAADIFVAQDNGSAVFRIADGGAVTGVSFTASSTITWNSASPFILNSAGIDCTALSQLLSVKLNVAAASIFRVTGGANTWFNIAGDTGTVTVKDIVTTEVIVANLPAAPVAGMRCAVSDSNAASFTAGIGAIVAGGGTLHVPVVHDGTNWRIG